VERGGLFCFCFGLAIVKRYSCGLGYYIGCAELLETIVKKGGLGGEDAPGDCSHVRYIYPEGRGPEKNAIGRNLLHRIDFGNY
jgi:hypothetical protein